jgi:transcriptional regulator GlxA family with amidase domain
MPNRVRVAPPLRPDRDGGRAGGGARKGGPLAARAVFAYFDGCEVLDFAGPLQAIHEANGFLETPYAIVHCGPAGGAATAQGLRVGGLQPLPEPRESDLVFVPGYPVRDAAPPAAVVRWVGQVARSGARLFSICTGAFVLARAGLLGGRRCTTHWRRTDELAAACPAAEVLADRLFVRDGPLTTSAGIAAGIDMTLDFLSREHGPLLAARVAREMVVFLRRDGSHHQESVYLDFRTHLDPGVHVVQDWLVAHPGQRAGLPELARVAHMSVRSLTRAFQKATGLSVGAYRQRVRLERARVLLANPRVSVEQVAADCGFEDARQLRRLWRRAYGASPRGARISGEEPA